MEYVVGQELLAEIIQELNRLPELGELVEFGCGTGSYTETIVPKTKSMFATDLSDSLLMANLIHVIESPSTLLQECYRILRKNGTLVIVTFTDHGMKLWDKIKM